MENYLEKVDAILAGIWAPDSWQTKTASQQPIYEDDAALQSSLRRLAQLPPLVTSWEIQTLKSQLAQAAEGNAFLLQGGDCSERIEDCQTDAIVGNLKVLMQMSFVLTYATSQRVIRVGRIAGQYAKPRSTNMETRDGVELPVYRGDLINRSDFTPEGRRADPELLIRGYERAAMTLNFIRSLIGGGFADLHHPENWDLDFANETPQAKQYHNMVHSIASSLKFMESILDRSVADTKSVDIYTSHEGLHLTYEQAQTQRVPRRDGWYNLNAHFPWIGNRTRQLDGAHIEYFRGIENPIGLKIGPATKPEELVSLVQVLNPKNELGRITLIHRLGADSIGKFLPPLISAVQKARQKVLWCSDPMHGNTFQTESGTKTRRFEAIVDELTQAFAIHRRMDSILGGVHLELTGDDVTECVGGATGLTEADLDRAYKSAVDPRLNYDQAMEIAFLIAEEMVV
ncbi:MAG: 3-deoxy-7-phosphoheptulonate synthase class II [Pirellulaceae bacterium]|nr:3-deoxy-7-phosphoheptulonate synthase class II [Pirellulaceae bacterium]